MLALVISFCISILLYDVMVCYVTLCYAMSALQHHTRTHIHINVYMPTLVYVCTLVYLYIDMSSTDAYVRLHMDVSIHTHTHIYVHTYISIFGCVCAHFTLEVSPTRCLLKLRPSGWTGRARGRPVGTEGWSKRCSFHADAVLLPF